MADAVLDASAILAFLNEEPGANIVEAALPSALLSAVNLSEVVSKLADYGASSAQVEQILGALPCEIVEFDRELAFQAGELRSGTMAAGLSLGDRACLATARVAGLPALTADRAWLEVDVGVDVRLIR